MIAWIVRARSAAEIPVVTPARASTDTVNAVRAAVGVRSDHQRDLQLVEPLTDHGHADHPARVPHDEGDRLGSDPLGRHDEIALVLAVRVVDDDHHPALPDLFDRLRDRGEDLLLRSPRSCRSFLSGFDGGAAGHQALHVLRHVLRHDIDLHVQQDRPCRIVPSVVATRVCGISATSISSPWSAATVRLTPSRVIEPFSTTKRRRWAGRRTDSRAPPSASGWTARHARDAVHVALDEMSAQAGGQGRRSFHVHGIVGASVPRLVRSKVSGEMSKDARRRRERPRSGRRRRSRANRRSPRPTRRSDTARRCARLPGRRHGRAPQRSR